TPVYATQYSDGSPLSEWMSTVSGDNVVLPAPLPVELEPDLEFCAPQSKPSTENQPSKPFSVESPVAPSTLRKYCSGLFAGTGVAAEASDSWVVVTALALASASVAAPVASISAVCGRPTLALLVAGCPFRARAP